MRIHCGMMVSFEFGYQAFHVWAQGFELAAVQQSGRPIFTLTRRCFGDSMCSLDSVSRPNSQRNRPFQMFGVLISIFVRESPVIVCNGSE